MGYTYKTGMELEFFLFLSGNAAQPLQPHDDSSYFDMSNDLSHGIRRKMISMLESMGIRVDSAHHEIGSGQQELDFDYNSALISADQVLTVRVARSLRA